MTRGAACPSLLQSDRCGQAPLWQRSPRAYISAYGDSVLPIAADHIRLRHRPSVLRIEDAVLAAMPEAQYEDGPGRDFVAYLVIAHDDPPDLARLIGFQLLADPRIIEQPTRRMGELLEHDEFSPTHHPHPEVPGEAGPRRAQQDCRAPRERGRNLMPKDPSRHRLPRCTSG